jgi:hypothetical protein
MFTDKQKTRIKNSVFALSPEKRDKIIQLASLVSALEDDEDIEYAVMISYLDDDMDKELDKALNDAQIASFSFVETDGEKKKTIPSKVIIKKPKK